MSESLKLLVLIIATAIGFYCVGRLHGALWLELRIKEIFQHGYRLGRKHEAESKAAHLEGQELLAELGAEVRRARSA